MSYGRPEIKQQTPPCPHCAARAVFRAVARPGEREQPIYVRCCECGCERADLEVFEELAA